MYHINHPYEILSPKELIDFIENLFHGNLIATEKIDGINLFIGFSSDKQIVFARNKTEKPFTSAATRFSKNHPAFDAFNAATVAIKQAFNALSTEELENFSMFLDGESNNFINAEILYGEVPNIISYSKLRNFIVFHSFNNRKDYSDPQFKYSNVDQIILLNKLAHRLGVVNIISDVIRFVGKPKNVERIITQEESKWEFKGPITVNLKALDTQLEEKLTELRGTKSFNQLHGHIHGHKKLSNDELNEALKEATKIAGTKLLSLLKSELKDPDIEIPTGHPGIEGLVVSVKTQNLQKHLVKITGDFRDLNQKAWDILSVNLPAIKNRFTSSILSSIFGINNLIKINDVSFRKFLDDSKDEDEVIKKFLISRSTKFKDAEYLLNSTDEQISNALNAAIQNCLDDLNILWLQVIADPERFDTKLEDIKRAILISAYQLTKLKESISPNDTVILLFKKVLINLYHLKFIKTENLIEVSNQFETVDDASKNKNQVLGIFIGKFDPPHKGHLSIINDIIQETDRLLIFISGIKHFLDFDTKKEILEKYLKDKKLDENIELNKMETGFIPDLIKSSIDFDKIKEYRIIIYSGSDRLFEYQKQFSRFDKENKPYWEYDKVLFKSIEREVQNPDVNKLLSLTSIPVNLLSSTLLRKLVRNGSDDAFRIFMNSQQLDNYSFNLKLWNNLAEALKVQHNAR